MLKNSGHVFILGDGPALRSLDLNLLEGHDCIGMNMSYQKWKAINWFPKYYTCLDEPMVLKHAMQIENLIANRNYNKIELFFIRKTILQNYPELSDNPSVIFYEDYLTSPCFKNIKYYSASSLTMLFAASLGYRSQLLLGMDQAIVQPIFGEKVNKINLVDSIGNCANTIKFVFNDNYAENKHLKLPGDASLHSMRSFIEVKKRLEKFSIDVVNCGPKTTYDTYDCDNLSFKPKTRDVRSALKLFEHKSEDDLLSASEVKTNISRKSQNRFKEKTILVSAYLSGSGQDRKIEYFERLNLHLKSFGYSILLLNIGREPIYTNCENITLPRYITVNHRIHGRDYIKLEDMPPEIIMSAAVEAETLGTSLVGAGIRLVLFNNYVAKILKERKPELCLMWHKFNGSHYALTNLCNEMGIPALYTEYGVLPGTISFDTDGQMAESWVSRRSEEFMNLPVNEDDLAMARNIIEYLKINEKSGKPQDNLISVHAHVEKARSQGKKIIFYAGQNDWASGMLPNALPDSNLHSPFYADTIDALNHLSELAEENNWQIFFKPHPMVQDRHKQYDVAYPKRIELISGANILDCIKSADVVTTIVSQVSYLALIHERPCVMLGRNQLRNKGCTGQPGKKDDVVLTFKAILRDGFHGKAKKQWEKHVAQICKYYLYAFDDKVESIIGRSINDAADYLVKNAIRKDVKSDIKL